jgi:hypothetical protein
LLWSPFVVGEGAILGASMGLEHPLFWVAPLVAPILALMLLSSLAILWKRTERLLAGRLKRDQ